jgi:hypothetical protein
VVAVIGRGHAEIIEHNIFLDYGGDASARRSERNRGHRAQVCQLPIGKDRIDAAESIERIHELRADGGRAFRMG